MKIIPLTCTLLLLSPIAMADESILAVMDALQQFAHKAQLSLDAGNVELAGFYLHELEEQIEELEEIDEYDGFPVGELAKSMLAPKYEQLDQAVDQADIKTAQHKLDELIETCNQCHQTTEHGFVVIQRNSHNVYLQDFSAR